ncbi:MAG: metalloprotease [Hyphomicrobium sp.]
MASHLWFLLGELVRIPFDIIRGVSRRRYVVTVTVEAPKALSWSIATAHKVTLIGNPPIEIDTAPDPARPGVFTGFLRYGDVSRRFSYRVLEERPGDAMSLTVLRDESDPAYDTGSDSVSAVAVTGSDDESTIVATSELTHSRFATRILVPLGLVVNTRRVKRTIEHHSGTPAADASQVKNALITGALTFASFYALFGWSVAAMLIVVILIHEFGHVIAMRWAGIPVRGIYFVPFFGGVAIGDGKVKSEVERGLVALMGPGFSLLTTALLLLLSRQSSDPLLNQLALTSALLNGFNLLPIFPLDGGHVAQALLSRAGHEAVRAFQAATMFAGGALAVWIGDYLLAGLLLLIAPSALGRPNPSALAIQPISYRDMTWLAIAYAATFVFYAMAVARLWGVDVSGSDG